MLARIVQQTKSEIIIVFCDFLQYITFIQLVLVPSFSLFYKQSMNTTLIKSVRTIHSSIDNNAQNMHRNTLIEVLPHHGRPVVRVFTL